MNNKKLPGLNGLRAIAATLVLVGHVYQIAGIFGVEKAYQQFGKHDVGKDMVNLFFVISGYIITHVLLQEKKSFGDISLRNFYIKRFLRIWPLYFLLIIFVFLIGQYTTLYSGLGSNKEFGVDFRELNSKSILLLAFFMVNFNVFFQLPVSVLPHYWSLSVEEQFYIFWPVIFKKIKPLNAAFTILFLGIAGKIVADYMSYHSSYKSTWHDIYLVLYVSGFGSIAIGAIAAIYANRSAKWLKKLFHPGVQAIAWLLFFASIFLKAYIPYIPYIGIEIMAALYAIIILNITLNAKTFISLENPFFNQVGTISYGLYMYHWPLIPLLIALFKKLGWFELLIGFNLLPLVIVSYATTYLISYLSFQYLELPLLKLKPQRHNGELAKKKKEKIIKELQTYSI